MSASNSYSPPRSWRAAYEDERHNLKLAAEDALADVRRQADRAYTWGLLSGIGGVLLLWIALGGVR